MPRKVKKSWKKQFYSEEMLQNSEPHTGNADHVSVTSNLSVHQHATDPGNTIQPVSQAHPSHRHNLDRHVAVCLPKLELPTFNGEPLEWHPFWVCFEAAIHSNTSLTNVQKLNYLRAQVKGEAARVIAGLPLTNLNYMHSVALLKDRYGQPHQIVNAHIQSLVELPKPSNKLASLRLFHDTIESHVRCQESLGKSPESLDTLLVQTMLSKLPEETKCNMTRNHQREDWTVQELQTGLRNEIRVFEVGQPPSHNSQTGLPPTASFIASTRKSHPKKDSFNKLCCVYCKGNHSAINCDTHTEVRRDHQATTVVL